MKNSTGAPQYGNAEWSRPLARAAGGRGEAAKARWLVVCRSGCDWSKPSSIGAMGRSWPCSIWRRWLATSGVPTLRWSLSYSASPNDVAEVTEGALRRIRLAALDAVLDGLPRRSG